MKDSPPTLDYRTPSTADPSAARRKAARHAQGNGRGCIIFGLCFGWTFIIAGIPRAVAMGLVPNVLVYGMLGLHAAAFFVGGFLYTTGSTQIERPNATWERILMVSGSLHLGIMLLTILLQAILASLAPTGIALECAGMLFDLLIAASLGTMIWRVRALRKSGE